MIYDQRVLDTLRRIVNTLDRDVSARDDLMQEALIHLWLSEKASPGQSHSWYLQGCRFRLQHYLASGRSVDSNKRRCNQLRLCDEEESTELFERLCQNGEQYDCASARDMIGALSRWLSPRERAVLECLADDLSTVEIARKLNLSTPTVTKYRRRVARVAARLGIPGEPGGTARGSSRKSQVRSKSLMAA